MNHRACVKIVTELGLMMFYLSVEIIFKFKSYVNVLVCLCVTLCYFGLELYFFPINLLYLMGLLYFICHSIISVLVDDTALSIICYL